MEFQITTDLATVAKIEFNHEELKKEISESISKFQGLVVTEDAIPEAKADRAKLNKLKGAIDDKRKEIKKSYLAPYNEFESKCKELTALVDEPIKAIDNQIKAFEEEQKTVKQNLINEYYSLTMGDLEKVYPLSLIWDNKWLNATFKIKDVQSAIDDTKEKIKRDTEVIKSLKSCDEDYILSVYSKTLDVSAAITEQQKLEEMRNITIEANKEADNIVEFEEVEKEIDYIDYTVNYQITASLSKIDLLESFMKKNGIEYKAISEQEDAELNEFPL
jgi:hypothetical protein